MNLELFNELMKDGPEQHLPEWQMFLEVCEIYLKKHKIKNPIVVELGIWENKQKKFYEQLLGAEYIGIDVRIRRPVPNIIGDTHDPKTLNALIKKLNGRPINILFIDANHRYEHVKADFEMYSPLCTDIVALHDIETRRYENSRKVSVWRFWDELKTDELKTMANEDKEEHKDLFLSIDGRRNYMGIGMIIKR